MQEKQTLGGRFRANSRDLRLLEEISAGDLFVGFLSSATSTRLMYSIAKKRAHDRYRNKRAIGHLQESGYVRAGERDGSVCFFITQEGKRALHEAFKETSTPHSKHWDGKWRVLIYDFHEQDRSRRNSLRYILTKSGFLKIQKSVWIFPYDAPLLTSLLTRDSVVRDCTIFMETTKISHGEDYKKHFRIK